MARAAQCPDCAEPISIVRAITVIRDGAVVLICPDCKGKASEPIDQVEPDPPESAKVEAASEVGPTPERPSEPEQSQEPEPQPSEEPEPSDEPEPEPVAAREASEPAHEAVDITGEIALHSEESNDRRPRRRVPIALGVAAAALLSFVGFQATSTSISAKSFTAAVPYERAPLSRLRVDPAAPGLVHELSVAFSDEQAALAWVHPIAGERQMPDKDDRRFGASRPGDRPAECGAGHCGVDLGGGRGTVIHAALGGKLIRVKHDASGASGRYVAIEHPQGLRSHYMHLDRVHPGLVEGAEVASGEAIGTLGSTGVRNSPPHLHFTVQKMTDAGWLYVDPEPMLAAATLLLEPGPIPEPAIPEINMSSEIFKPKAPPKQNKVAKAPPRTPKPKAKTETPRRRKVVELDDEGDAPEPDVEGGDPEPELEAGDPEPELEAKPEPKPKAKPAPATIDSPMEAKTE